MGELSDAQTTIPLREANLLPGNKRISLLPLISVPKEVSLDFLHSLSNFPRDSEKTKGIDRQILKRRFDKEAFPRLAKSDPFPTIQFPVESVQNTIPEGLWGRGAQRETEIGGG